MDGHVSRGGYSMQRKRTIVPGATAWWSAANPDNTISGGTAVVTYADKSGNSRTITQGTASKRPVYGTGTGDTFDGTDDQLDGTTWGALFAAATHTYYVAFTPLAWSTTAALSSAHLNHGLTGDNGAYLGVSLRNVAGSEVMLWVADGVYKGVTLPATLNTPMVVTWRHSGGTLYGSVNGGAEVSAACGDINASGLGRVVRLGIGFSVYANFKFLEGATYNTSHSAAEIAHNVATMRGKWGF